MSAATLSRADAALIRLGELKEEFERKANFGRTRQELEWQNLGGTDRKLILMLAGVGTIDAMETLAAKKYRELTPPEREAISVAVRSLRRLVARTASLGAMGAGVV